MNAHATIHADPFGPDDPYKYARASGTMQSRIWTAAWHLNYGKTDAALDVLRETLEQFDPDAAAILWPTPSRNSFQNGNSSDGLKAPTPPALSEDEMAQLVAEDEAADRRAEAWDRANEIADRNRGMGI